MKPLVLGSPSTYLYPRGRLFSLEKLRCIVEIIFNTFTALGSRMRPNKKVFTTGSCACCMKPLTAAFELRDPQRPGK